MRLTSLPLACLLAVPLAGCARPAGARKGRPAEVVAADPWRPTRSVPPDSMDDFNGNEQAIS
jgi:hypothetical protein